jgi:hypothetical protein
MLASLGHVLLIELSAAWSRVYNFCVPIVTLSEKMEQSRYLKCIYIVCIAGLS